MGDDLRSQWLVFVLRYQSLKLNLIFYYYYFCTEWFQTEKEFTIVFEEMSPQELNKSHQALSVKTAKPNFNGNSFFLTLWLSQFPAYPSPLGICRAFVILFWKSCKCPTVGLKNIVQIPHPGTTPKLYFPVNKLKIPFLWEISNSPIETCEPPTQIAPSS